MLEEKGISTNSLAVDMGIGVGLLHKWKSKYGKNKGGRETKTSEAELKRLRKRLLEVEEERDILKKAVAIFTQVARTEKASIKKCIKYYYSRRRFHSSPKYCTPA